MNLQEEILQAVTQINEACLQATRKSGCLCQPPRKIEFHNLLSPSAHGGAISFTVEVSPCAAFLDELLKAAAVGREAAKSAAVGSRATAHVPEPPPSSGPADTAPAAPAGATRTIHLLGRYIVDTSNFHPGERLELYIGRHLPSGEQAAASGSGS